VLVSNTEQLSNTAQLSSTVQVSNTLQVSNSHRARAAWPLCRTSSRSRALLPGWL
jgi:hypothetical protein